MTDSARFLDQVESLPAFPAVLTQLLTIVRSETATASTISELIEMDPGLTSNALRIANSPAFRGSRPIQTAFEAVSRLGIRKIGEFAVGAWLRRSLPPKLPVYEQGAESFWMHSLATGVISNRLAISMNLSDGVAGIAGLLHDVGKLVIAVALESEQGRVLASLREGSEMLLAERAILGTDHMEVGHLIARRWNLPDPIANAIADHHENEADTTKGTPPYGRIVHLADAIAHSLGFGADIGGLHRSVREDAITRLGLSSEQVEQIVVSAFAEIQSIHEALRGGAS